MEHPDVLARLSGLGMRSLYYNSGAFGFPAGVETTSVGWIGPPDETIRPAARALARAVSPPAPATLAALFRRAWESLLPGPVWVMPKSHWAYELDFGSTAWLPDALRAAGMDPAELAGRNAAAAVVFDPAEAAAATTLVEALLTRLTGSDFAAAWPGRRVACTIHSHRQLWWTTADADLMAGLDALVPAVADR